MELPEFFAKVSHDLKSPMRQIKSFVQLLESDSKLSEEQQQLVDMLVGIADKGIHQVMGLEKFAKALNVNDMVCQVVFADVLRSVAKEHETLTLEGLDELEFELEFSLQSLKVILSEIFSNAQKYCPEGTNAVLSISSKELLDTGTRALKFSSPSVGVSHDNLDKLLIAYARDSQSEDIEGFGMGLTIVSYLVSQSGGSLSLMMESDECFSVVWTLAPHSLGSHSRAT